MSKKMKRKLKQAKNDEMSRHWHIKPQFNSHNRY